MTKMKKRQRGESGSENGSGGEKKKSASAKRHKNQQ